HDYGNTPVPDLNHSLSVFHDIALPRMPTRIQLDIREVVDHVAALIREDPGRAQRVTLDVRVDPAVPPFAFDADQMTQVLWNIALHGVEAIEERGRLGIAVGLRRSGVAVVLTDTRS